MERRNLNNKTKDWNKELPVLTVITVVRNCENEIEQTIKSVLNQSCKNIEFIVIDGASTDNTLNIITKYQHEIDYWISEPDLGIYDAMNKGILLATGDWVNFMNAGDEFVNMHTCSLFSKYAILKSQDIIYGDVIAKDETNNTERLVHAKSLNQLWKGMVFHHQSTFIKTHLLKKNLFDLKYKIVSDFNQILSFYLNEASFEYIPKAVSRITISGISYSNIQATFEKIKVIHDYKPYSYRIVCFFPSLIVDVLRYMAGKKLGSLIRKIKWTCFIKSKLL